MSTIYVDIVRTSLMLPLSRNLIGLAPSAGAGNGK
jgi:hypothetical protein